MYLAAIWSAVIAMLGSCPCFGCVQLSQVAGTMACTAWLSPGWLPSPLMMVSCFWYGLSGSRIGPSSKSVPSFSGVHFSMMAPCGKYMNPSFTSGFAAVLASAVPAGIIASSSGSAIIAPAPRSIVRG